MKNLFNVSFKENRLVFMGIENSGGAETINESKERLFNTEKLYEEFTGYLGEGTNNMMDKFGKCRTGGCFKKHISSWFNKYLGRIKATGFRGSLTSREKMKYKKALWKKLVPDLRSGGKKFTADVQEANTKWIEKVEAESKSHGDTLARKIREIIKKYAPYTQNIDASRGGSSSAQSNPNLPKVKRGVAKILKQVARKFRISYTDLDMKGNGAVSVKANLKKVITYDDAVNKRRIKIITAKFSKEAKKKYPKAVV